MPSVIRDTCTNCKVCESVCPTKSIFPGGDQYVIDTDTCMDSGLCIKVCPVGAIFPSKKAAEIQKDKDAERKE